MLWSLLKARYVREGKLKKAIQLWYRIDRMGNKQDMEGLEGKG